MINRERTWQVKPTSTGNLDDFHGLLGFLSDTGFNRKQTLNLEGGLYDLGEPTHFPNSNGDNLKIIGAPVVQTAITSIHGTPTGSAHAWSVTFNVASTTDIEVGDWAKIALVSGTGDFLDMGGACAITAIDSVNNRVTVLHKGEFGTWPTGTVTAGFLNRIDTILFYDGVSGWKVLADTVGYVDNVAIIGSHDVATQGVIEDGTMGVVVGYLKEQIEDTNEYAPAALDTVAGTTDAAPTGGNITFGKNVIVADFQTYNVSIGMGGAASMDQLYTSGAGQRNVMVHNGGQLFAKAGNHCGAGQTGVAVDPGAFAVFGNSIISGNGSFGGLFSNSTVELQGSHFGNNGNYGYRMINMARVQTTGATFSNNVLAEYSTDGTCFAIDPSGALIQPPNGSGGGGSGITTTTVAPTFNNLGTVTMVTNTCELADLGNSYKFAIELEWTGADVGTAGGGTGAGDGSPVAIDIPTLNINLDDRYLNHIHFDDIYSTGYSVPTNYRFTFNTAHTNDLIVVIDASDNYDRYNSGNMNVSGKLFLVGSVRKTT